MAVQVSVTSGRDSLERQNKSTDHRTISLCSSYWYRSGSLQESDRRQVSSLCQCRLCHERDWWYLTDFFSLQETSRLPLEESQTHTSVFCPGATLWLELTSSTTTSRQLGTKSFTSRFTPSERSPSSRCVCLLSLKLSRNHARRPQDSTADY